MGREVKRVPMDFDWPVGKVWYGYLIYACLDGEEGMTCEDCHRFQRLTGNGDGESCCHIKSLEPPSGTGWQMWETTTAGSPISPVFKTKEDLAEWLSESGASVSGDHTATYDQWLFVIEVGYCPTAVFRVKEEK